MKAFTMSIALALLASLASAAPAAPQPEARQVVTTIAFIGAADGIFYLTEPVDGSSFPIYNPLSISHIQLLGGATCSFKGIDGSFTTVFGGSTVDVGPPQTQVEGTCW